MCFKYSQIVHDFSLVVCIIITLEHFEMFMVSTDDGFVLLTYFEFFDVKLRHCPPQKCLLSLKDIRKNA